MWIGFAALCGSSLPSALGTSPLRISPPSLLQTKTSLQSNTGVVSSDGDTSLFQDLVEKAVDQDISLTDAERDAIKTWDDSLWAKIKKCLGYGKSEAGGFQKTWDTGSSFACAVTPKNDLHCAGSVIAHGIGNWQEWAVKFKWEKVVIGYLHICGLLVDKTPRCFGPWGVGDVPTSEKFIDLATGYGGTCGIRLDQSLKCWGVRDASDNDKRRKKEFEMVPTGKFVKVYVGEDSSEWFGCAMKQDGTVDCWGGKGNYPYTWLPPPGSFTDLATYDSGRVCGLRSDGTVECWGPASEWKPAIMKTLEPFQGKVVQLAASQFNLCVLLKDGQVGCQLHNPGHASFMEYAEWGAGGKNAARCKAIQVDDWHVDCLLADNTLKVLQAKDQGDCPRGCTYKEDTPKELYEVYGHKVLVLDS